MLPRAPGVSPAGDSKAQWLAAEATCGRRSIDITASVELSCWWFGMVWYTLVYFTTNHYNEISLVIHVVLFFSVPPTTNDKNLCPLQVYGIIQWFSRGFLDHTWTTLDLDFFSNPQNPPQDL